MRQERYSREKGERGTTVVRWKRRDPGPPPLCIGLERKGERLREGEGDVGEGARVVRWGGWVGGSKSSF